ncbi:hypothetical protein SAMN05444128_3042 [Pontibacter indicus]|uniref:Secreted protein n=2 Tax=Pontibacter indicus TaxID=1317125 RepID=A0A1R3XNK4_9BACT|nr:hypothetical protein SAMN05444128_3042 [Pontibacter indicus]
MKKTGLILLGGLLFISLSHGGSSKATEQNTCAAASVYHTTACAVMGEINKSTALDATVATVAMEGPAEEQETALPDRLLQLLDTFARLVMVI